MRIPYVLFGLMMTSAAVAQERPQLLPQRDVVVTYAVNPEANSGPQQSQEIAFSVAAETFRMMGWQGGADARSGAANEPFFLYDLRNRTETIVAPGHRVRATRRLDSADGLPWNPVLRGQRLQTDTVAGVACTDWRMTHPTRGQPPPGGGTFFPPHDMCFTTDGVILRRRDENGRVLWLATSVSFSPQDLRQFQAPADYRQVTQQQLMEMF